MTSPRNLIETIERLRFVLRDRAPAEIIIARQGLMGTDRIYAADLFALCAAATPPVTAAEGAPTANELNAVWISETTNKLRGPAWMSGREDIRDALWEALERGRADAAPPAPSPTPPSEPEVCLSPDECNLRPADVRARCVCVTHDDSEPADSSTSKARELAGRHKPIKGRDDCNCSAPPPNGKECDCDLPEWLSRINDERCAEMRSLCDQIERMAAALEAIAGGAGGVSRGGVALPKIAKRALSPPVHTQEK